LRSNVPGPGQVRFAVASGAAVSMDMLVEV